MVIWQLLVGRGELDCTQIPLLQVPPELSQLFPSQSESWQSVFPSLSLSTISIQMLSLVTATGEIIVFPVIAFSEAGSPAVIIPDTVPEPVVT